MSDENRPWLGAPPALISWDEDSCPRSEAFADVYFSRAGGPAETRHVFLAGNQLPGAWNQHKRPVFTIVETGFGTGLNFLVTWQQWRKSPPADKRLHFISIEKYPLRIEDLQRALAPWIELEELAQELLSDYPPPLPGQHRLVFDNGNTTLDLLYGDIDEALPELCSQPDLSVDAWYLDGFAPARNEAMWNDGVYASMSQLSERRGTVATFTAAGHVRRGLERSGFDMRREPGFGGKREMLQGEFGGVRTAAPVTQTPWHIPRRQDHSRPQAVVVGAGLAGAHTAAALARRNWQVTVIDADAIASGASGNRQGILYTRLSHRASTLNTWSLHSYLFASRYYRKMLGSRQLQPGIDGELCGALQLMPHPGAEHLLHQTLDSLPGLAHLVDAEEAMRLTGVANDGGLFFPAAGWMSPPAVCRALLASNNISIVTGQQVDTIERKGEHWCLYAEDGTTIAETAILVIASGIDSMSLAQLEWLPLQSIRGQVSHISNPALEALQCAICHDGYISPSAQGEHCIGATFDIDDSEPAQRTVDHRHNLDKLAAALPGLASALTTIDPATLNGRVGFRAASPDYLPIVGPVPDYQAFCEDYAPLRKNARQLLQHRGSYLPGLYLSTGHGSRGLTATPLAAELLAAQICGEGWPLESELVRALSPARFPVRDLSRNRV